MPAVDFQEYLPVPKAFTHKGIEYVPYAVIMYGSGNWIVPLSQAVSEDGTEIYHRHIILWRAFAQR